MTRARIGAALVCVVAAAVGDSAAASPPARPRVEAPTVSFLAAPAVAVDARPLPPAGWARLSSPAWRTGRLGVAVGEGVDVRVSAAYASDPGAAQRWADFFGALVHGPELGLLTAYVAPLAEVQELCGARALGCYGANRLVMVGDSSGGIPPATVAAHEYGHHVANNRLNPPWRAVDWGTKRWATHEGICSRTAAGTAYPGDEDANYQLNPGEAFAEAYRVLNETSSGLPPTWPIVDSSFFPDPSALDAVRADVLDPWVAPVVTTRRVRFTGRTRTWATTVSTPLDGSLAVRVQPGSADVTLAAAAGRPPLERGAWTSSGAKVLEYPVCGRRTFVLRLRARAQRFTVRLSVP